MKKCIISCGRMNKTKKTTFLILSAIIVFFLLNDSIFGFNYSNIFSQINMCDSFINDNSKRHKLIEASFNYLGICLFGAILYLLQKFVIRNKTKKNQQYNLRRVLIYYNSKSLSKKNKIYLLILIIIWVVGENLIIFFGELFKDLDFWFLELIFLSVMLNFFFGVPIYKHHWFSIILNISLCSILKITNIVLSFTNHDTSELYVQFPYFTAIGIIIDIIIIGIRSLYITGIKWFIDLKFISHTLLLIIYGAVGAFLSIIGCVIATYLECNKLYNDNIVGNICFIQSQENSQIYYFDNYKIYFNKVAENYLKIILIIIGIITYFGYKYFYVLMIKKYNPVFVLFCNPIIFFLEKIILMINTLIKNHSLFIEPNNKTDTNIASHKINFWIDISNDIIVVIGLLIYLEVIIINCYGLNHNVKINIEDRGIDNYRNIEFVDETGEFSLIVDDE